jgi:hypothetical protein
MRGDERLNIERAATRFGIWRSSLYEGHRITVSRM